MAKLDLQISVDDKHLSRLDEVAHRLRAAGMDVQQQLDQLGIITGSIDAEKVRELAGVEGVSQVEQSRTYQLAPPGADIQ